MSEREPGKQPGESDEPGQLPQTPDVISGDVLAAKLRAVQQALAALAALDADSGLRNRLNLRFMAICTSLKMPGASMERGKQRLDLLMTDAERARRQASKEV